MNFLQQYNPYKLIMISLLGALLITYPNITQLPWKLSYLEGIERAKHINFSIIRFVFFTILAGILFHINLKKISTSIFRRRLLLNLAVCAVAYLVYVLISYSYCTFVDCFGSILIFQFLFICMMAAFTGHVYHMYKDQRQKEQEIEQLKIENLESRCNALSNQINPHFFFNSLNSVTALVRKGNDEKTIEFVNKLSDMFRYILNSENKGLVSLGEELEFVASFRYLMEVRFANKLDFIIDIEERQKTLKLPSLSILPVIDNVVAHNTIDSEHKMEVQIRLNERDELEIHNPIFPKLSPDKTNGTGLKNLENRFLIMMNKKIRVHNDGHTFIVFLPLKQ
ncbi:MAG: histidine kinase [Bacteroidales bacterium]|nr:histidine kinase [Bacteroidales bacterium]